MLNQDQFVPRCLRGTIKINVKWYGATGKMRIIPGFQESMLRRQD